MFYYNNERFKWITLLYSLLCFIMVTSFLCLYKTSHIIIEKPFYAKSYQESLDYPTSTAFFYDQFAVVSTAFKDAPPDSIRGKLWAKALASGRLYHYRADYSQMTLLSLARMREITKDVFIGLKAVCIIPAIVAPLSKSVLCGLSPEHELWVMKITADPIEKEVIYGLAHAINFHNPLFSSRMKNAFETKFYIHFTKTQFDQSELIASVAGTSMSHQFRQKVICDDENASAPEPVVKAISLSYFASFFEAILVVWLLAFIVHVSQILRVKKKTFLKNSAHFKQSSPGCPSNR